MNISGSNLADATTSVFFGTTPAAAFSIIRPNPDCGHQPRGSGHRERNRSHRRRVVAHPAGCPVHLLGGHADLEWCFRQLDRRPMVRRGPVYPDNGTNANIGAGSVQVTASKTAYALAVQDVGEWPSGQGPPSR